MSKIFENIKQQSKALRLARSPLAATSLHVISSITAVGKDSKKDITDDLVISTLRNLAKKTNEVISLVQETTDTTQLRDELRFVTSFLPVETSVEDIQTELESFFVTNEVSKKSMGIAIKHLKEKFGSNLNPSVASSTVKTYIEEHSENG